MRTRSTHIPHGLPGATGKIPALQNLVSQCSSSRVGERIHHRLFHPDSLQMSVAETSAQNFVNDNTQILGSRNLSCEFRQRIQVLMAKAFDDLAVHEAVEINQIADHPC